MRRLFGLAGILITLLPPVLHRLVLLAPPAKSVLPALPVLLVSKVQKEQSDPPVQKAPQDWIIAPQAMSALKPAKNVTKGCLPPLKRQHTPTR